MSSAARRVGGVLVVVVLAAGAYGTADAYDVVPGVVTLAPVPPPPEPFPTAPAAVEAPELSLPWGALDPDAPLPDPDQVQSLVETVLTDPRMGTSGGAIVADLLTGQVLAQDASTVSFVPASTSKILTGAAALSALGGDTTLTTRAVLGAPDQVVLVGGGDIMLAAGAGDPTAVNGRAGLADLALATVRELRLAGRTSVRVAVDASLFSGPAVSPTWTPSNVNLGFVAPVTALAVNIAKMRDEPYPPRYPNPSRHAAEVFAAELERLGITVEGAPAVVQVGREAQELAAVHSAPVRDVVAYMLQTSDNTVAEALGRLVAVEAGLPGSFDGGTQAVLREVRELGVDTAGVVLADSSGLGEGSMIPPATLIEVMRHGQGTTDPVRAADARDLLRSLPVAGLQGTLADRYHESAGRGLVRAKTGSLTGVTSLAGTVVDADGRALVFAIVADQTPPGGQVGPRRVIDEFVGALAGCGCTPAG